VNSEAGRRPPAARSRQVEGDRWGVVLSGGGLGLLLAVIPIALCDYSGHGVFMADKRLELLLLGMLVGACGGTCSGTNERYRCVDQFEWQWLGLEPGMEQSDQWSPEGVAGAVISASGRSSWREPMGSSVLGIG